jgi:Holliday junction resolvase RusA-like endonuclease
MKKTIKIRVMGKPRMTRADAWKKRKCVTDYRLWADELRLLVFGKNQKQEAPLYFSWVAYIAMPKSWSEKKKLAMIGEPHRQKPDLDNVTKGLFDALFEHDERVASGNQHKIWALEDCISIEWGND